jgi:hypothetical protein
MGHWEMHMQEDAAERETHARITRSNRSRRPRCHRRSPLDRKLCVSTFRWICLYRDACMRLTSTNGNTELPPFAYTSLQNAIRVTEQTGIKPRRHDDCAQSATFRIGQFAAAGGLLMMTSTRELCRRPISDSFPATGALSPLAQPDSAQGVNAVFDEMRLHGLPVPLRETMGSRPARMRELALSAGWLTRRFTMY